VAAHLPLLRRAAATLRISQPALTKSIQTLESDLGVKLFERRREGVIPTEFGKLALKHAQDMLLVESEFLRQINLLAGLGPGRSVCRPVPIPPSRSPWWRESA